MATYEAPPLPPPLLTEEQVDRLACQGHLPLQLPSDLANQYATLFTEINTFFAQAPEDKAAQYPAGHGTELGYYHVPSEKEYLTLRSAQGRSPLETSARETWRKTMALFIRAMADISWALGVDPSVWDPALDDCAEMPEDFDVDLKTLMRLFRYEPNTGTADAHTDNGLLTLCMGNGRGLQLWEKDPTGNGGRWIDAKGPTLLTGITLKALSSGAVNAGKHRVVGNPEGRNSIVFALRACTRHELDLRLLGGEGSLSLRALHERINAVKVNVNAQKEIREKKWREKRERRMAAGVESGG